MQFKFGDCVITNDNKIGIVIQVHKFTKQYFIAFQEGGRLYDEDEVKEWHGAW